MGSDLTIGVAAKVTIELIFSEADFSNTLAITSPALAVFATGCNIALADGTPGIPVGLPGVAILSEKPSQRGCRALLDSDSATPGIQGFDVGTVFEFAMCAQIDADADCDHVWSSDPAENSDGKDHVITTPLYPTDYPGRIFQMAWEDRQDLGDADFDDLIVAVRLEIDADGDSLWDDWEQFGIDTNADGTIDLDLPSLGANKNHKDIFLEIDYMDCVLAGGDCGATDTHTHEPKTSAVNAVIQAFADAPVGNPDGLNGINLHIDIDDGVAHDNYLELESCPQPAANPSFDDFKIANFGTTNPRRFAYHYMVFAHQMDAGTTSSGCAELPGNDILVTLGGWDGHVGTEQQQAGTLMHELGHNLNLQHGGDGWVNYKPNYVSIMNYAFQTRGIPPTDPDGAAGPLVAKLDYSREDLPDLDETNLNEPAGIGDGADQTRYTCPTNGQLTLAAGTGPIDWNCDGDTTDVGITVDLNPARDGWGGNGLTTLTGFNDWPAILYDFQRTGDYEDGTHSPSEMDIDYLTSLDTPLLAPLDIKPGSSMNSVNPGSHGKIPVAILSAPNFDAAQINPLSLTFGRTGFEASLGFCNPTLEDVNGDGLLDLFCHFETQATGLQYGDIQAMVRGRLWDGSLFQGVDAVRTVPPWR